MMAGYYMERDMYFAGKLSALERVAAVCLVKAMPDADLYTLAYMCNPFPGLAEDFEVDDGEPFSSTIYEELLSLQDLGYIGLEPVRPKCGYKGLVNAIMECDPAYRMVRAEAEKLCKGDVRTYRAHVIEEIERKEGKQ